MLSLYTPTGSNPASLTCMELTLKPLEALTCKNVGLGPRERAYFWISGSGVPIHTAVKMLGSAFSLILLDRGCLSGWDSHCWRTLGADSASTQSRFSRLSYPKASSLHSDSAIQSWYQSRGWGTSREMRLYSIRRRTFFGVFWESETGFNKYEGKWVGWGESCAVWEGSSSLALVLVFYFFGSKLGDLLLVVDIWEGFRVWV